MISYTFPNCQKKKMSTECKNLINLRNQNTRTGALIGIGLIYLFFGAFIFHSIEQDQEVLDMARLTEEEERLKQKYNISSEDMDKLAKVSIDLEPYKAATQWDYTGALYFSIIVLTTIGYGHSVPHTVKGKIFCMIYSLIGVPLYLVMFQAMGERINNAAKYAIKKVGKRLGLKCSEVSLSTLVPFGFFSCVLTVTIGTVAFSKFEGWSTLDSVYYCVVTLTTIGFGDYVPLQEKRALEERPSYVVFSFIYILLGLTIIGAFVNLVVLRLMVTTATGEPPKEEETQVDGFGESAIISSYQNQANFGCNPYNSDDDQRHDSQGHDNQGVSLPGMNGDIRNRYSVNRSTTSKWYDDENRNNTRQRSFKTSPEEKMDDKINQRSRYSDGIFYDLYRGEGHRQSTNHFPTNTNPKNKTVMKFQDFKLCQNKSQDTQMTSCSESLEQEKVLVSKISPPIQAYENNNESSKLDCVVCRTSCSVCSNLFSLHRSFDSISDAKIKKLLNQNGTHLHPITTKNTEYAVQDKSTARCCSDSMNTKIVVTEIAENTSKPGRSSSLRIPGPDNPEKTLLEVNSNKRARNLSMDSGYEGMVNEFLNPDNTRWRSRSVNLEKPNNLSNEKETSRPSFLSLTSPPESTDVFSLEASSSSHSTSSTCIEPDTCSPKSWTPPYSFPGFVDTEKNRLHFEKEGNFSKRNISFERQTWPPIGESNHRYPPIPARNESTENTCADAPAIVITLCDDDSRYNSEKPDPSENSPDDTELVDVVVEDNNNLKLKQQQNNDLQSIIPPHKNFPQLNIIRNLCREHQTQYQKLYNMLSGKTHSKLAIDANANEVENVASICTNGLSVPRKNNTESITKSSIPTTKLCSNGSVVTDYKNGSSVCPVLNNGHTHIGSSVGIRRAYSCGTADQKLQQHISRLSQSFRGRIKTMENSNKNGVTHRHAPREWSSKSIRLKNMAQSAESPYVRTSNKKDSLPVLDKPKRRKKTRLDMIRMFLLKNKQNGRRRANVSTVFNEKQTPLPYTAAASPIDSFGGSDPTLKHFIVINPVHSASTQSLPNSTMLSTQIRNGKYAHNQVINGDALTYAELKRGDRNLSSKLNNKFETDNLPNGMAIY